MPTLTGGEAVVRMLQLHGVDFGFGMGGFQALPYYDAMARQSRIRHIVIRDEKHGAFAADGYARVKNRPAIADGTLGPGATNLISGAAESYGASIPLLLMTSEVNSGIALRGATQESNQFDMLKPTCKLSLDIRRIERIPEMMRRAFAAANGGRPGPVNINISEDVFHGTFDYPEADLYADPDALEVCSRRVRPDSECIERAAKLIRGAHTPVLLVGGGVHLSKAYASVKAFAESTGMPVATTISGKGALSDLHPLAAGICGRYSRVANDFIASADVLVVAGCKLGEIATSRWTLIQPRTSIIQLDIDPEELGKVFPVAVGVWADMTLGLDDLTAALPGGKSQLTRRSESEGLLGQAKAKWHETAQPQYHSTETPIHMARLLHELRSALPADAILVADGGFAAHWSALLFDVHQAGRTYIANRGHAAIGYGLPGAIGAKLAAPDVPVVALCGDNGFAMAVAELETAKRSGANVIAVVVNNNCLGYVKALQHSMYEGRYVSVDFLDTDYGMVAQAFGSEGTRVVDANALASALRWAMEGQIHTPVVLDVLTTTNPAQMLPGVDARTKGPAVKPLPAQT
jgi:acetolactate synthase-1/2/3 large subunit